MNFIGTALRSYNFCTQSKTLITSYQRLFFCPNKLGFQPSKTFQKMAGSSSSKFSNRLTNEKSPYLLQHAHNPVDWFPWCDEAFAKAKAEDKLIFLSVGYSTCHWCHVMERESFESEEVAKVMNEHFICVKVDREERPDIDHFYMMFLQSTAGGGGWPMSVWITPTLSPIKAATYFPPSQFVAVLKYMADRWDTKKYLCLEAGSTVMSYLEQFANAREVEADQVPNESCLKNCLQELGDHFEPNFGGFSRAPKFPQPVYLRLLLHVYARSPKSEDGKKALDMVNLTLEKMAKGGIHDHIAQGFARYSTDSKWHVPHFEKMLYDQAQLVYCFAEAHLATKSDLFAEMVKDIMTYVNRDLSHPEGGFYSAEDADSLPSANDTEKKEGAFCVWTKEETSNLLKESVPGKENITHADVFNYHYNVKENGNVNPAKDPHGELQQKNVLIVFGSEEETAAHFDISLDETKEILRKSREILYAARLKRPKPHLDDKMLTCWNGLMISGVAKAGQVLSDSSFVDRAIKAAVFVRKYLYIEEEQVLLRSCYKGTNGEIAQLDKPIRGFLDDYAFMIGGLLDLYESCFDARWLEWADDLQKTQDRIFWDEPGGAYFTSPEGSEVPRWKYDSDGAEPSGNSISVHNLIRLSALLNNATYGEKAARILRVFAKTLHLSPTSLPMMMSGCLFHVDSPTRISITGNPKNPETSELLSIVNSRLIPGRVVLLADGDKSNYLYRNNSNLDHVMPVQDKQRAYVCHKNTCILPAMLPAELNSFLDKTFTV